MTTQDPKLERLNALISVLRDYLMDQPEVNHLIEGEEFSDKQLALCLLMTIDTYDNGVMPRTSTSILDFPSLTLLLEGGAMEALKQAVFKYIRNSMQYNDAGVQFSIEEKSAEYERTIQRLREDFMTKARLLKEHINIEQCYGGFSSEYLTLYARANFSRRI